MAAGGAGASPYKALKSIQLCSTITVRGAFSSDVRFGLQVRVHCCFTQLPTECIASSIDRTAAACTAPLAVQGPSCSSIATPMLGAITRQPCACTVCQRGACFPSATTHLPLCVTLQTLPRDMVLSHSLDPAQLRQIWCPAEPTDAPEPVHINK